METHGRFINGKYYSAEELRRIRRATNERDFESFLVSGVIAGMTGSAFLGALIGGDIGGALIGDLFDTFFGD